MNIQLKPYDFTWDNHTNAEPLSLEICASMPLSEVIEFVVLSMNLTSALQVSKVPDGQLLDQSLNFEQLQIKSDTVLCLYAYPMVDPNHKAILSLYIDDIPQVITYQISFDSTGADIIQFFKEYGIFDQAYTEISISNVLSSTSDINLPIIQLGISDQISMHIKTKLNLIMDVYYDHIYVTQLEVGQDTLLNDIHKVLIDNDLIQPYPYSSILRNANGPEYTKDINSAIKVIGLFPKYRLEIYTAIKYREIKYQWQWQEGSKFNDYDDHEINEQIDIGFEEFLKNNKNNEIKLKFPCSKYPGTHIVNLKKNTIFDKTLQTVKPLKLESTLNKDQYLIDGKPIPSDLNQLIIDRKATGSIKFEIFSKKHKIIFSQNEIKQVNEESNFTRKVQKTPYTKPQKLDITNIEQLKQNIKINAEQRQPSEWNPQTTDFIKVDLPTNHVEYRLIMQLFLASNPNGGIHKIFRLQNLILWDNYMTEKRILMNYHKLKQQQLSQIEAEIYLWHGVKSQHPSIIYTSEREGFDVTYSKDDCLWGPGVYFAEKSIYSKNYSYQLKQTDDPQNAGKLVLLCCLVTTGKVHTCRKDSNLRRPPDVFDYVSGTTNGSQVYILYQMTARRAYPAYEIIYD